MMSDENKNLIDDMNKNYVIEKNNNYNSDDKKKEQEKRNKAFLDAIEEGNMRLIEYFMERDYVDMNIVDENSGMTPLAIACHNGSSRIVKMLLEKGACVNRRAMSGKTPLCFAMDRGRETVVRLLVEHGASTVVKCEADYTPYEYGNSAIREVLRNCIISRNDEYREKLCTFAELMEIGCNDASSAFYGKPPPRNNERRPRPYQAWEPNLVGVIKEYLLEPMVAIGGDAYNTTFRHLSNNIPSQTLSFYGRFSNTLDSFTSSRGSPPNKKQRQEEASDHDESSSFVVDDDDVVVESPDTSPARHASAT